MMAVTPLTLVLDTIVAMFFATSLYYIYQNMKVTFSGIWFFLGHMAVFAIIESLSSFILYFDIGSALHTAIQDFFLVIISGAAFTAMHEVYMESQRQP